MYYHGNNMWTFLCDNKQVQQLKPTEVLCTWKLIINDMAAQQINYHKTLTNLNDFHTKTTHPYT